MSKQNPALNTAGNVMHLLTPCFPKGSCAAPNWTVVGLSLFFLDVFHYIVEKNFFNFYACKELFRKFKADITGLVTETIC